MKYFLTILVAFLAIQLVWSQSNVPQSFSYQAVARDNNGVCLSQENLTVRLTVLDGPGGSILYSERHSIQTNSVGHFHVNVGEGARISGTFNPEDWLENPFLRVDLAPGINQTSGFNPVGEASLKSVPYALLAENGKFVNSVGADFMSFSGPNEELNVVIENSNSSQNNGAVKLYNTQGEEGAALSLGGGGFGTLTLKNAQGKDIFEAYSNGPGNGYLEISSVSQNTNMFVGYSPNDNFPSVQVNRTATSGSGNAGMFINANGDGAFACSGPNGGVKHFVMPHPQMEGKEIWYASIEGPEAAAYERGTAQLINGEAEIVFPEHFQIVTNPVTMTITTSPRSADSKGLAVVERTATGFKVKELFKGKGTYQFDWRVDAKRIGHEDFQVIRDASKSPFNIQVKDEE